MNFENSNFGFRNSKLDVVKQLILCLLVFLSVSISVNPAFAGHKNPKGRWKEYKADHFIIYYHPSISYTYIKEFTKKCEEYYDLITERLGFNRYNFWLWEDRAKIYIYKSRKDYIRATSRPVWSGSAVHIFKKHIDTFYFNEDFFDIILPHELTHITLREFIGRKTKVPLWFDEGVASANEKDAYLKYLLVVKGILDKGIYIPVSKLETMKAEDIKFPSVFYSTAASLVIYLLEEYKKDKFVAFCNELKDGNNFYKSMYKVYGIRNSEELNKKFLDFIGRKTYKDLAETEDFDVKW